MEISFPKEFIEEVESFKTENFLNFNIYSCEETVEIIKNGVEKLDKSKPIIIFIKGERDTKNCFFDFIIDFTSQTKLDIRISMPTPSFIPHGCHPFTNIYTWKDTHIREKIDWNSDVNQIYIIQNGNFLFQDENVTKNKSGILSVRKRSLERDRLFERDLCLNNGIVRYGQWPIFKHLEEYSHIKKSTEYPTIQKLIKEYQESYFSFVVESENNFDDFRFSVFTEKTLIAFLTKTMPVVFGYRHFVKDLTNLGFKVWNDELGFGPGDEFSNGSEYKMNCFKKCIDNLNKMSFEEIKIFHEKNLRHIENNYNLINQIMRL